MLMPKNGAATATPCGKNNMAAVYSAYNGHAAPDAFQQMAMPLNGQYPVASKLWIASIGFIFKWHLYSLCL